MLNFYDFPGMENQILKFHDFPGFPCPVRTLGNDSLMTSRTSSPSGTQPDTVQFKKHHQNITFAAEVSETETKFLDTTEYKGERFKTESVLDVHSH